MMPDITHWESHFIDAYIVKRKRDRYHSFLTGAKHRKKLLDRLNHALDYDPSHATRLDPSLRGADALIVFLQQRNVDSNICCLMADGNANDATAMTLAQAVGELLDNHWGAVIICPPKPIAVYKEEDIGDLILLADDAT